MRSFIFCTSCICNNTEFHYFNRYKRWVNHYRPLLKSMHADCLFLIDDGGIDGHQYINTIENKLPNDLLHEVNLYRFGDSLGRRSNADFPGWWRSFLFSIDIADKYGYKKIIHIESDFFILSPKLKRFIRDIDHGWSALYSHFYKFPETGIQVICEDAFPKFEELKKRLEHNCYASDTLAEYLIPFTNVKKNFIGDRIGDGNVLAKWMTDHTALLGKLDYVGQINVSLEADSYTW